MQTESKEYNYSEMGTDALLRQTTKYEVLRNTTLKDCMTSLQRNLKSRMRRINNRNGQLERQDKYYNMLFCINETISMDIVDERRKKFKDKESDIYNGILSSLEETFNDNEEIRWDAYIKLKNYSRIMDENPKECPHLTEDAPSNSGQRCLQKTLAGALVVLGVLLVLAMFATLAAAALVIKAGMMATAAVQTRWIIGGIVGGVLGSIFFGASAAGALSEAGRIDESMPEPVPYDKRRCMKNSLKMFEEKWKDAEKRQAEKTPSDSRGCCVLL